jgi:hypothetical protein
MEELGFKQPPAVLFQDNQSTILVANRGPGSSGRTKSINGKYFQVTSRIEDGEIVTVYISTHRMIADLLTKYIGGEQFRRLVNGLLNSGRMLM